MANDCLQTKLKSSVNNDNLDILGKISMHVIEAETPSTATQILSFKGSVKLHIVGDGYFISNDPEAGHWSDGTNKTGTDDGKTYEYVGNGWTVLYASNGNYNILVDDKYSFTFFFVNISGSSLAFNANEFTYNPGILTQICFGSPKITGDLFTLVKCAATNVDFSTRGSSISGSLKDLLSNEITINIAKLNVNDSPYITDKDADTIAALEVKYPGITIIL